MWKKFQEKKAQLAKECKTIAHLFAESYMAYLRDNSASFYSTWHGHPYGVR